MNKKASFLDFRKTDFHTTRVQEDHDARGQPHLSEDMQGQNEQDLEDEHDISRQGPSFVSINSTSTCSTRYLGGHHFDLTKACRVCGKADVLNGKCKPGHLNTAEKFKEGLYDVFKIDVETDVETVHPKHLCNYCLKLARKKRQPVRSNCTSRVLKFTLHDSQCPFCLKNMQKDEDDKQNNDSVESVESYNDINYVNDDPVDGSPPHKKICLRENDLVFQGIESQNKHEKLKPTVIDTSMTDMTDTTDEELTNFLQKFRSLNPGQQETYLADLCGELTEDERAKLAECLGSIEKENVRKDSQRITNAMDFSTLSSKESMTCEGMVNWLSDRNKVVVAFLRGLAGFDGKDGTKCAQLVKTIESIYNLIRKRFIGPFSFKLMLMLYYVTGSRRLVDTEGCLEPCGTYSHLKRWITNKMATSATKPPEGCVMNTFDNEQRISYSKTVNQSASSRSSVITTHMYTEVSQKKIQNESEYKPRPRFSLSEFDRAIQAVEESDLDESSKKEKHTKLMEEKERYIEQVKKMRDSDLTEGYFNNMDRIHLAELFNFVQNVINNIVYEINNGISDVSESNEHEPNIVKCFYCEVPHNDLNGRKQKCDNCKRKDGISRARKRQQELESQKVQRKQKSSKVDFGLAEGTHRDMEDVVTHGTKFDWIKSNHKGPVDVQMGDPIFVNPNSKHACSLVLRQIGRTNDVQIYFKSKNNRGEVRYWTLVCCDGRPYVLLLDIMKDNLICKLCHKNLNEHDHNDEDMSKYSFQSDAEFEKHCKDLHAPKKEEPVKYQREFDWFYLRIGGGHYEMNVIRAFFELNWEPFLENMCKHFNFKTPKALQFAKGATDHHLSFYLLLIYHSTTLHELVFPYVKECLEKEVKPKPEGFYKWGLQWAKKDSRFHYLLEMTCEYSQAILNFRGGIRRNNADLVNSAKFKLRGLFWGRAHPYYQKIELFDQLQYFAMPEEVRQVWDENVSITRSGDDSRGQDFDFILEEKNRNIKSGLPRASVPSESTWQKVISNLSFFESLKTDLLNLINGNSNDKNDPKNDQSDDNNCKRKMQGTRSAKFWKDMEDNVTSYRGKMRSYVRQALENSTLEEHRSMSGKHLHEDLAKFTKLAENNRREYIDNTFLSNNGLPKHAKRTKVVNITKEEEENCKKWSNMSKEKLIEYIQKGYEKLTDESSKFKYKDFLSLSDTKKKEHPKSELLSMSQLLDKDIELDEALNQLELAKDDGEGLDEGLILQNVFTEAQSL